MKKIKNWNDEFFITRTLEIEFNYINWNKFGWYNKLAFVLSPFILSFFMKEKIK